MVNNEMSEEVVGETGELAADCSEGSATQKVSQSASEAPSSPTSNTETSNLSDEETRLSPTTLFCSLPLNRDVQSIIDTFPKTEADRAKKTRKLPCLYCERTFVADNLRQKHVERCHSIKQARRSSSRFQQAAPPINCLFCDKFVLGDNDLGELFRHLVSNHPTKYFGCLSCNERFTLQTQLKEHQEDIHGMKQDSNVQSVDDVTSSDVSVSAITDDSAMKTRHKAKIKYSITDGKPTLRKSKFTQKELRGKRIALKSTKMGIKRSARLQSKVVQAKSSTKKRPKPKDRVIEEPKVEKDIKITPTENPYPTFDAFYRVKKITDHSIDNLRITSLTFNDVFDQAFFTRIKCNIRDNLLNHLDGKLFKNEESESRISNFEKTQPENTNTETYGCELSLNAATPVTSLLTTQFGDDPELQIEYGSKASKKKSRPDEVHYKYFTRRKYQASILESKENRDLSKLDMWTQFVIKSRQQTIIENTKSDKERQDYKKGDEYRAKSQNDELNRILDRRGPFEDLKEESKKAALEGNYNQEAHTDVSSILDDILGNVFSCVIEDVEIKTELTDAEIPSYLNLRKASLNNESFVDKSDKITLICSSQETENFEAPQIPPRDKNSLVELTGEWARSRLYICAACGLKLPNLKLLMDHKNIVHQNVWCQHYEFVGNQGNFYKNLSIPGLGKMSHIEENVVYKVWRRSEARVCTKCKKQCNSLGELHRHILECGEDWSWMLVRKKCKYKPYGAKTRKKRRGLFKRIIHKEKNNDENREKKTYKKVEGPRVKPSDAETIERMLANLPAKRATRKLICMKDGFSKNRKVIQNKKTDNNKVRNKKIQQARRNRAELILQESNKIIKRKLVKGKCNPVGNLRKSVRNLNKVISSKLIDSNSTLLLKRKLKSAMQDKKTTRRSIIQKEEAVEEKKKPSLLKKIQNAMKKKEPVEDNVEIRKTRSSTSLPGNDDQVEEIVSPVKKKTCKKMTLGSKIMRTLSLRKKNVKTQAIAQVEEKLDKLTIEVEAEQQVTAPLEDKSEQAPLEENSQQAPLEEKSEQPKPKPNKIINSVKNNGKRKSKFESIKNAVKKMKIVKKSGSQKRGDGTKVVGGHFLEEGSIGPDTKIIEENSIISEKTPSEIEIVSEMTPLEVNVSEIISSVNEEIHVDIEVTEPAIVKLETIKHEEPKKEVVPKKICKRAKGLNACIAMLTSKLQLKDDVLYDTLSQPENIASDLTKEVQPEEESSENTSTILNKSIPDSNEEKDKLLQPIEGMESNKLQMEDLLSNDFRSKEMNDVATKSQQKGDFLPVLPISTEAKVIAVKSKTEINSIASLADENPNNDIPIVDPVIVQETNIEEAKILPDTLLLKSPEKKLENQEITLGNVVDIIKCFENMNTKENINENIINEEVKNNKRGKKGTKKMGSIRKRQTHSKVRELVLNDSDKLKIPEVNISTENCSTDAIVEEQVRKIGQKRVLPKRKSKPIAAIEKVIVPVKELSVISEESYDTPLDLSKLKIADEKLVNIVKSTSDVTDTLPILESEILTEETIRNELINSNLQVENEPDILENKMVSNISTASDDDDDSEDELPLALLTKQTKQDSTVDNLVFIDESSKDKTRRKKYKKHRKKHNSVDDIVLELENELMFSNLSFEGILHKNKKKSKRKKSQDNSEIDEDIEKLERAISNMNGMLQKAFKGDRKKNKKIECLVDNVEVDSNEINRTAVDVFDEENNISVQKEFVADKTELEVKKAPPKKRGRKKKVTNIEIFNSNENSILSSAHISNDINDVSLENSLLKHNNAESSQEDQNTDLDNYEIEKVNLIEEIHNVDHISNTQIASCSLNKTIIREDNLQSDIYYNSFLNENIQNEVETINKSSIIIDNKKEEINIEISSCIVDKKLKEQKLKSKKKSKSLLELKIDDKANLEKPVSKLPKRLSRKKVDYSEFDDETLNRPVQEKNCLITNWQFSDDKQESDTGNIVVNTNIDEVDKMKFLEINNYSDSIINENFKRDGKSKKKKPNKAPNVTENDSLRLIPINELETKDVDSNKKKNQSISAVVETFDGIENDSYELLPININDLEINKINSNEIEKNEVTKCDVKSKKKKQTKPVIAPIIETFDAIEINNSDELIPINDFDFKNVNSNEIETTEHEVKSKKKKHTKHVLEAVVESFDAIENHSTKLICNNFNELDMNNVDYNEIEVNEVLKHDVKFKNNQAVIASVVESNDTIEKHSSKLIPIDVNEIELKNVESIEITKAEVKSKKKKKKLLDETFEYDSEPLIPIGFNKHEMINAEISEIEMYEITKLEVKSKKKKKLTKSKIVETIEDDSDKLIPMDFNDLELTDIYDDIVKVNEFSKGNAEFVEEQNNKPIIVQTFEAIEEYPDKLVSLEKDLEINNAPNDDLIEVQTISKRDIKFRKKNLAKTIVEAFDAIEEHSDKLVSVNFNELERKDTDNNEFQPQVYESNATLSMKKLPEPIVEMFESVQEDSDKLIPIDLDYNDFEIKNIDNNQLVEVNEITKHQIKSKKKKPIVETFEEIEDSDKLIPMDFNDLDLKDSNEMVEVNEISNYDNKSRKQKLTKPNVEAKENDLFMLVGINHFDCAGIDDSKMDETNEFSIRDAKSKMMNHANNIIEAFETIEEDSNKLIHMDFNNLELKGIDINKIPEVNRISELDNQSHRTETFQDIENESEKLIPIDFNDLDLKDTDSNDVTQDKVLNVTQEINTLIVNENQENNVDSENTETQPNFDTKEEDNSTIIEEIKTSKKSLKKKTTNSNQNEEDNKKQKKYSRKKNAKINLIEISEEKMSDIDEGYRGELKRSTRKKKVNYYDFGEDDDIQLEEKSIVRDTSKSNNLQMAGAEPPVQENLETLQDISICSEKSVEELLDTSTKIDEPILKPENTTKGKKRGRKKKIKPLEVEEKLPTNPSELLLNVEFTDTPINTIAEEEKIEVIDESVACIKKNKRYKKGINYYEGDEIDEKEVISIEDMNKIKVQIKSKHKKKIDTENIDESVYDFDKELNDDATADTIKDIPHNDANLEISDSETNHSPEEIISLQDSTSKSIEEPIVLAESSVSNNELDFDKTPVPKLSVYDFDDSIDEDDNVIMEITSDNSKENMDKQKSPKRVRKKIVKHNNIEEENLEPENLLTPLKDNKNTEALNESSFIQTPDLNDSKLTNKISKLKIKSGKINKKNKKKPEEELSDNYCDICNKSFVRNDSLVKHKRTLTHIAKLSEIEAKEAAEKSRLKALDEMNDDSKSESIDTINNPSLVNEEIDQETTENTLELNDKDSFDETSEITNVVENEVSNITHSISVTSPFNLKTNNDTLKLADIINDVLNKPVAAENIESFSDILHQDSFEPKRYKSLGERKSFDSDSINYTSNQATTFTSISNTNINSDTLLEKQISMLENIIEEGKASFQYMDEISVESNKSDDRCPSDMSLVSDIKPDDSNIISFTRTTTFSEENFVKPSQYEEISEDTRNFEEQRARKALNRDEELFLECCSLLKSSSEISNYSKKSSMVNNYRLKGDDGWLENKIGTSKHKFLSENSCPDTPIGDNYEDFSNSDTIKTDWNTKMNERQFEDISLDSVSRTAENNFKSFNFCEEKNKTDTSEENSKMSTEVNQDEFRKNVDAKFVGLMEVLRTKDVDDKSQSSKKSADATQTSIMDYAIPIGKKAESCSDSLDSKKLLTKGAMKVFEGLKVSIPTEELDMNEVLNCSPTLKRLEIEADEQAKDETTETTKLAKTNLKIFGNKLGLKVTKKRVKKISTQDNLSIDDSKIHDVYDFEETQDNTDVFIPNNLKSFRTQVCEKKIDDDIKDCESDTESNNHYIDSFSVEGQSVSSFSTETESSTSLKKNTGLKNITKKKCVIMGRIFKNAFKSKSDEIKDLPTLDNSKVAENVINGPKMDKGERPKMTEQEMDMLFDKLLEEQGDAKPKSDNKVKSVKGVKQKKRARKASQSSDDEFNVSKTTKKRVVRKKVKVKDNAINLEQELKECMGVAGRKSQRKCTSGKQNVLVEDWSSDDSEFEAMLRLSLQNSTKTTKPREKIPQAPLPPPAPVIEEDIQEELIPVEPVKEPKVVKTSEDTMKINPEIIKEIVKDVKEAKPKANKKKSATSKPSNAETVASNRRKRAAAETLYYWSSSSDDDDSQNLIEIKSVRDDNEEDDDRPMQHGWIVGDSPKKLVTMLAQAKGKKIDTKCVKEQGKKRTTI